MAEIGELWINKVPWLPAIKTQGSRQLQLRFISGFSGCTMSRFYECTRTHATTTLFPGLSACKGERNRLFSGQ